MNLGQKNSGINLFGSTNWKEMKCRRDLTEFLVTLMMSSSEGDGSTEEYSPKRDLIDWENLIDRHFEVASSNRNLD